MATMRPDERKPIEPRSEITEETGVRRVYTPQPSSDVRRTAKAVAGGSIAEALAGAGGAVLAILGLAGVLPGYMAAIACIAIGVALLAHGGAIAARWPKLTREVPGYELDPEAELGGGMGGELLGGIAGVVLGILALLGIVPTLLIPIAVIVFGATLLFASPEVIDLTQLGPGIEGRRHGLWRQSSFAASGTQLLAGIAAVILGIVALTGVSPLLVSLVGFLVVGSAILLTGMFLGTRLTMVARH